MTREQLLAALNIANEAVTTARSAETVDPEALASAVLQLDAVRAQLSALDAATAPVVLQGEPTNAAPAKRQTLASKALASDVWKRVANGETNYQATIDIRDVRDALDIFTDPNSATGSSPIVAPDYLEGIALKPVAPLNLLNYIPQSTTQSDTVVIFVESGFTDNTGPVARRNGATPADYTAYTESGITFTRLVQTVSKVGTVFRTDTSTLADQGQLANVIENRLVYGIKNNLIAQMVSATDTVNGIPSLVVTGTGRAQTLNYTLTGLVAETNNSVLNQSRQLAVEAVRQAITKVQETYTPATYVLASASFIEAISLAKDDFGGYLFASPVSTTQQLTIWGLPVVWCPQLNIPDTSPWGGFVVGSSQYVSLVNRQQIVIGMSENVGTDFIEDAVRFRGSIRVALTNVRPEAFCVVTAV